MFSWPSAHGTALLSREYIPHIAALAYARARGYEDLNYSFSLYRQFKTDAITKKVGTTYETDIEFYDDEVIHVQVEAKGTEPQARRLAASIATYGTLTSLPTTPSGLLTLPEAVWELFLGIYCAWKGFRLASPLARPEPEMQIA